MNCHHSAVVATHAPIRDDVLKHNQPVRARIGDRIPRALKRRTTSLSTVFVYRFVEVRWLATSSTMRDVLRLGSFKPVYLMATLFNDGCGGALHSDKLLDWRAYPAIQCRGM